MDEDMDESKLKRITCAVCLEIYVKPYALPCLHTYCEKCLKRLLGKNSPDCISCPECRKLHKIENSDVTSLSRNFWVVEMVDQYSSAKSKQASKPKPARSESPEEEDLPPPLSLPTPTSPPGSRSVLECREHGKAVSLYCRLCDKVLCDACVPACAHNQERQDLRRAVEERRKMLTDLLEQSKQHKKHLSSNLPLKTELEEAVATYKSSLFRDVEKEFEAIHSLVNSRCGYFKQAIEQGMQQQRGLLFGEVRTSQDRISKLEQHCTTIDACLGTAEQPGSEGLGLLTLPRALLRETEGALKTPSFRSVLDVSLEAIKFSAREEHVARLRDQIACVGHLTMGVHAPHCHIQGLPGTQQLSAGARYQLQLVCANSSQQPCQDVETVRPQVSVRLVSRAPEVSVEGTVLRGSGNVLFVTLVAPAPGNYQFHATINGQHVGNSPLDLVVQPPAPAQPPSRPEPAVVLPAFSFDITEHAEKTRLSDIAVTKSGTVVATDMAGDRALVYGPNGKFEYEFGSRGAQEGQFNEPRSVAVDEEENIFIADYNNHRVQKFNSRNKGRYLLSLGALKKGNSMMNPSGVTVGADSTVYVSESFTCRILTYTTAGVHQRSFNLPRGEGPKQMKFASSIAVGPTSKTLYLADKQLSTVHVISSDGTYQRRLIDDGKVPNKLRKPFGIAVNTKTENVFVAEGDSHCITMVTKFGSVHHFGKKGVGKDNFNNPQGLFYHSQRNLLYVADQQNKRIVVYKCN